MSPVEATRLAVSRAGSQSALARICGQSQTSVHRWANGETPVPPVLVLKIEAATGVSRHLLRPDIYGFADAERPDSAISGWTHVKDVKVDRTGEVRVFGKSYWCPKMAKYIGWEVEVRLPPQEFGDAMVWSGQDYLCSPGVIANTGFLDADNASELYAEYRRRVAAAEEAARKTAAEERASIVCRRAALLIDLIDKRIEERRRRNIFRRFARLLAPGLFENGCRGARIASIDLAHEGDGQIANYTKASLEIAKAIFEHPHLVVGSQTHRDSPSAEAGEPIRANDPAHCLSEAAK